MEDEARVPRRVVPPSANSELPLSPIEPLELVSAWKRGFVAIAVTAFVIGVCILIGSALLAVLIG